MLSSKFVRLSSLAAAKRALITTPQLRCLRTSQLCSGHTSSCLQLRGFVHSDRNLALTKPLFRTLASDSGRGNDSKKQRGDEESQDENDPDDNSSIRPMLTWTFILTAAYIGIQMMMRRQEKYTDQFRITWFEFVSELLAKGEVLEIQIRPEREIAVVIVHPGCVYKGQRVEQNFFIVETGEAGDRFESKVREEEKKLGIPAKDAVNIHYRYESMIGPLLAYAFIMYIGYLIFRGRFSASMKNFNPSDFLMQGLRKAPYVRVDVHNPHGKISFKDVAGLREAKIEIMEFVDYLRNPLRFKEIGARLPRGAVLLGPPGTGKTLLAKAVAAEARVPFLAMAGSEFVEMLGGLGASRVRDLFAEAKRRKPCIVFIDEIDAIGRRRSGADSGGGGSSTSGNSEEEHTLNQLLVEMDGMKNIDGVIVFAATNRWDMLDPALMRPGRFDRHIYIDLPTLQERQELFAMYLAKIRLSDTSKEHLDALCERLGQMTPSMTGADIANICNEAAIRAGTQGKPSVSPDDLEYALAKAATGSIERRSGGGMITPQERRVVAVHEAGHAVLAWLLLHAPPLLKLSIAPRTSSIAQYSQYMPQEHYLISKEQLFDRMCLAFGGRAAEAIVFNHLSTNAQDDLRKVTKLAFDQVRKFGMSEAVGPLSFNVSSDSTDSSSSEFAKKPYSKRLSAIIDEEARRLVASAYARAEELLRASRDKLDKVSAELSQRESLRYEDLVSMMGEPVNAKLVQRPRSITPNSSSNSESASSKTPEMESPPK